MAEPSDKGKFKFEFKPNLKFKVWQEAPKAAENVGKASGKEPGKTSTSNSVEDKLAQLQAELDSEKASASSAAKGSSTELSPLSNQSIGANSGSGSSNSNQPGHTHMAVFWAVVIFSVVLSALPYADILFTPVNQFTTLIHEMGHAFATILTGGQVTGLTMVGDGQGHGGLTRGLGGINFITVQAGYLGTAITGCALVFLSKYRKWSRYILLAIGMTIAYATIFLMPGGIFSIHPVQAFFSILWGVGLASAIIWAGLKLKDNTANLLLLFLAIQTAADSIKSIVYVIQATMMGSAVVSDAVVMQQLFFLPAIFWSVSWVLISLFMLASTIWFTYGTGIFKGKTPKTSGWHHQ